VRLLIRWGINAVVILAMGYLLPDKVLIVGSVTAAVAVAVVLGLLNTFVRPVFVRLTLPLSLLSLGLFVLVVNAIMLKLLSWLIGESYVLGGVLWLLVVALLVSLLTTVVNIAVGGDEKRPVRAPRRRR
jgi:putative membrane protein